MTRIGSIAMVVLMAVLGGNLLHERTEWRTWRTDTLGFRELHWRKVADPSIAHPDYRGLAMRVELCSSQYKRWSSLYR